MPYVHRAGIDGQITGHDIVALEIVCRAHEEPFDHSLVKWHSTAEAAWLRQIRREPTPSR